MQVDARPVIPRLSYDPLRSSQADTAHIVARTDMGHTISIADISNGWTLYSRGVLLASLTHAPEPRDLSGLTVRLTMRRTHSARRDDEAFQCLLILHALRSMSSSSSSGCGRFARAVVQTDAETDGMYRALDFVEASVIDHASFDGRCRELLTGDLFFDLAASKLDIPSSSTSTDAPNIFLDYTPSVAASPPSADVRTASMLGKRPSHLASLNTPTSPSSICRAFKRHKTCGTQADTATATTPDSVLARQQLPDGKLLLPRPALLSHGDKYGSRRPLACRRLAYADSREIADTVRHAAAYKTPITPDTEMWGFFSDGTADAWVIIAIQSLAARREIIILHVFKRTQHRAAGYAADALKVLARHFIGHKVVMPFYTLAMGRLAADANGRLVSGTTASGTYEITTSP